MSNRDEDAIDAMLERMAREEQDDLDRAGGQSILDAIQAHQQQRQERDPLLGLLNQAWQQQARDAEGKQE